MGEQAFDFLRAKLTPAAKEPDALPMLRWISEYAATQAHDSADDVIRFIMALDPSPEASPHALVSRLFAAAQRAKAYADRVKSRR